ncbi:hypothetical protein ACQR3C_10570 [Clostridium perfringens]|uniref:hypothetical protein n=1 Tax=Clostridium perfringens TaxID=1502 RepID=UPI0024447562|nr:hypothetical protein [Clostridium perfringens]MDG6878202.1 hypothetical protein [Clostridium perfringens]MDG6887113.1 hypothetical protein [Clostridium perfringens]MDK0721677.1 hypothetical protein [Clostridium perfringens]MDK0769163.1 hypothetical protein [Clostridium perfringens]MDK0771862.1 hypothetical protein [Clostridium perfringens]
MIKKLISGALLATTITVFSSITALAAGASAPFSASFYSGEEAVSYLDGSQNGKYYSLTPGRASLDVTSMYGKSAVNVSIRLKRFWSSDMVVDTKEVEWPGHYTFGGVPETSSKYYLFFQCNPSISNTKTQYKITGTVNDWH